MSSPLSSTSYPTHPLQYDDPDAPISFMPPTGAATEELSCQRLGTNLWRAYWRPAGRQQQRALANILKHSGPVTHEELFKKAVGLEQLLREAIAERDVLSKSCILERNLRAGELREFERRMQAEIDRLGAAKLVLETRLECAKRESEDRGRVITGQDNELRAANARIEGLEKRNRGLEKKSACETATLRARKEQQWVVRRLPGQSAHALQATPGRVDQGLRDPQTRRSRGSLVAEWFTVLGWLLVFVAACGVARFYLLSC